MTRILVSQQGIVAGRDNIGRDQINTNINFSLNGEKSPIAAWMAKLEVEIRNDQQVLQFIDTLQMYQERHSHDGVTGLENKLIHSGRNQEAVNLALQKKELFTRLMAKYAMFDSAQNIFAYLLSKLENDFRVYVLPNIAGTPPHEVDELFTQYLVGPCADEIKSGVFCLNAAIASGMVYWLAEQCYIRWHP